MPGPAGAPYVTAAQLPNYFPAAAFNGITSGQQAQACIDATGEADSRLSGRYQMPLLAWGADLTKYTAWIAIYNLLSTRGFSPQGGADSNIIARYYEAVGNPNVPGSMGWFDRVQRQAIHPDITPTVASNVSPTYNLPQVFTSQQRGWACTINGKPVV